MPYLLEALAGDCRLRDLGRVNIYDGCGAHFPDLPGTRPPDLPYAMRPKLKVVGKG